MQRSQTIRQYRGAALLTLAVWACAPLPAMAQNLRNRMVTYSDKLKAQAQAGDTDSQVALGVAYLQGNGVGRRYDQAVLWFKSAFAQGSPDAAGWLGGMYLMGQGVLPDPIKGSSLIDQSRTAGSAVGLRYSAFEAEKGIGRAVNGRLAIQLYEVAAAHRDPVACDRMGLVYQTGRVKKQDLTKASDMYQIGASAGYSWSQLHLGELYASNAVFTDFQHGRTKDSEPWLPEAYEMYTAAASSGNRVGAFRAGQALRDGSGVTTNVQSAAERFQQAAQQQYGPAQEALADLSVQHSELGRSKAVSLALYREAAANGQTTAASKADALAKQMSPAEIASASQRVNAIQQAQQQFTQRVAGLSSSVSQ